jgi:chromosome segregation protein
LAAAEQYDELKGRYDVLTAQQEDLEESIRALQKAIQKINRTSRKRFREAFARLDEEFRKVFPMLFEGGEAHLVLTEAEDVLDSGVEIVARPTGKRLQSISLLSGGEKALTAVALIFAMIMIKRTPFCLFDEVDAPLDDANIDRFNGMIRGLSKDSQFILVTHSKRTMEMADSLYGVTMEKPGVSKTISVRLQ